MRFLTRYDGEVSEPLVGRQGSRVSMRVARGSASLLPSHGRGIWPRREIIHAGPGTPPSSALLQPVSITLPLGVWAVFNHKRIRMHSGADIELNATCPAEGQVSTAGGQKTQLRRGQPAHLTPAQTGPPSHDKKEPRTHGVVVWLSAVSIPSQRCMSGTGGSHP